MSHKDALKEDARLKLAPGQVLTAVIIETDVDDEGKALTKREKVTTFIDPCDFELKRGDTVMIKIYDRGESHADALVVAKPRPS